jgi:hypothetical protein
MAKHPRFMGRPVYGLKGRNGDWPYIYLDGWRMELALRGWPEPEITVFRSSDGDGNIRLVYCDVVPGPLGTPGDSHGIKRCPELIRESL